MLQLIAKNQINQKQIYLDVDSEEDISLDFAVSEVKDFSSRQSSRSNSFTLPFTDTNNTFFNHFYDINLSNYEYDSGTSQDVQISFDAYKKTDCEILVDGLTQLQGYLYIESVNLVSQNYSVVVIGEIGNLKDELGEKKLVNLDDAWQTTFAHALTKSNIVNSWDDNITYLTSGADQSVIKYPFVNYGIDNKVWTIGGANLNDITTTNGAIQPYEFKPAMKVKTILDRILLEAGYTYDSNFLDNNDFNFSDIYMTLANNTEVVKDRPDIEGFLSRMSSNGTVPAATPAAYPLEFNDEVYDPSSNFNTAAYSFIAPKNGTYGFRTKVILEFTSTLNATQATYRITVHVNSQEVAILGTSVIQPSMLGQKLIEVFEGSIRLNLNLNDIVVVKISAAVTTSGDLTHFIILKTDSGQYSEFQLTEQPATPNGNNIYLQDNWATINQINYLKAIFEHFNMFIEPKQDDPTQLIIEPYPDYMDRGISLDWTDKLNLKKEVQLNTTSSFRKSKLEWKWSPDKNYLAKYRQDISLKNYGSYVYEDQSDLTSGKFTNFTEFGEPTNRLINTSGTTQAFNICVMDLTARDSNAGIVPLKGKPRIAYFKKKSNGAGNQIKMYNEATDVVDNSNNYGYYGHYSDVRSDSSTYNLNFSETYSGIYDFSNWVSEGSNLNPFKQYWNRYLNEIYSPEARILKASFNLTPLDIHNLRFNNKIFVKDCFYRINKISGYKPNNTEPCQVELIKIFESNEGLGNKCRLVPTSFDLSGVVNFTNPDTGTAGEASRDCCEAYGYIYIGGDSPQCLWKPLSTDNGSPFLTEGVSSPEG